GWCSRRPRCWTTWWRTRSPISCISITARASGRWRGRYARARSRCRRPGSRRTARSCCSTGPDGRVAKIDILDAVDCIDVLADLSETEFCRQVPRGQVVRCDRQDEPADAMAFLRPLHESGQRLLSVPPPSICGEYDVT